MRRRRVVFAIVAVCGALFAVIALDGGRGGAPVTSVGVAAGPTPVSPIQHVVLIYQENHSFDNVLGYLCATEHHCDGATTGQLWGGTTIPLSHALDVTPVVNQQTIDQETAVDGGKIDGFDDISGCEAPQFACYSQFQPADIRPSPTT